MDQNYANKATKNELKFDSNRRKPDQEWAKN